MPLLLSLSDDLRRRRHRHRQKEYLTKMGADSRYHLKSEGGNNFHLEW